LCHFFGSNFVDQPRDVDLRGFGKRALFLQTHRALHGFLM
jgi:hypothetical protein